MFSQFVYISILEFQMSHVLLLKKPSFASLTLLQITTTISLLDVMREPLYGFTLEVLYEDLRFEYSGTKEDLLVRLNFLKEEFPRCFFEGKYWGVPKSKH